VVLKKLEAVNHSKNIKVVIEPEEFSEVGTAVKSIEYYLFIYDLDRSPDKCIEDWLYAEDQLDGLYSTVMERFGIKQEDFYEIP